MNSQQLFRRSRLRLAGWYALVQRHQGQLVLDSKSGQGSVFTVSLLHGNF
jgi:signal transduction histidine kinase